MRIGTFCCSTLQETGLKSLATKWFTQDLSPNHFDV